MHIWGFFLATTFHNNVDKWAQSYDFVSNNYNMLLDDNDSQILPGMKYFWNETRKNPWGVS